MGPLERMHLNALKLRNVDCDTDRQGAKVISLQKIFTLFGWLLLGTVAAILTLIYEIFMKTVAPSNQRQRNDEKLLAQVLAAKSSLEALKQTLIQTDLVMSSSIDQMLWTLKSHENTLSYSK